MTTSKTGLEPGPVTPPSKAFLAALLLWSAPAQAADWTTSQICNTIRNAAAQHSVPLDFFARLIWTESRFDVNARSPVGAQGVAQFMPATAKERGLKDPYDPAQALPASAELLSFLHGQLGNWPLAAAAYNAGESRVSRWVTGRSRALPFETQNYIVSIFNVRVDRFRDPTAKARLPKLDPKRSFEDACQNLPIIRTRAKPSASLEGVRMPWGVQVSANFSRNRAMNSWLRVRSRLGLVVSGSAPALYRVRTPRGMKSRWAVRLGTSNRKQANRLCGKIRRAKGSCIVLKTKR